MDVWIKKYSSKNGHTHTKIGCEKLGIYGGSFMIPYEDIDTFYKVYKKHVLIEKKKAYFTEKQLEEGPLLIDLDFRYVPEVDERQHNMDDIVHIVELLFDLLSEIKIPNDKFISCSIFEKPNVNTSLEEVTKDGIHIIMDVKMDFIEKIILREKLLKKISSIYQNLPVINTWDQVVDEGVMKGTVNWQLYGSQKPGNEAYELTYRFKGQYQENEWNIEQLEINQDYICKHFSEFTARNTNLIELRQNKDIQEEYVLLKTQRERGSSRKCKVKLISSSNVSYEKIDSPSMLDACIDELLKDCSIEEEYIKDTHNYTMILDESYYGEGSYNKWIKVGMALKNTSEKLFISWLKLSSQSSSFDWGNISELHDKWRQFYERDLSYRSIIYWAKESSIEKYNEVRNKSLDKYIHNSLMNVTHWDLANTLNQIYKDNYKCVNIKHSEWYSFEENRWIQNDSGTSLRNILSTKFYNIYFKYVQKRLKEGNKDSEESKNIAGNFAKLAKCLKTSGEKNNVMKESCELFYDKDFYNKLDTNPYLVGCKNGVVDIKQKEFRKGSQNDYIHKTTNIDYMPLQHYQEVSPEIIDELNTFMYQLFPEQDLREYMWDHLASTLIGTNNNQTFNIYLGPGANGKSILVDLMSKILGDYKGTVPSTLITQKRTSIGSTSSEVYQLIGRRYAVMQELSKGDTINEGIMKEITGGDPIQCRALFKDSVTFIPQFKLVVCTNVLFDVKSNDDGTWRRIRVCEFKSKFTDRPYEDPAFPKKDYPYQFKIDKNLNQKFNYWAPVFLSILVEKAFQTQGKVIDRPCVLEPTENYRRGQDVISEFCHSQIVEEPNDALGCLKIGIVNTIFNDWFKNEYGKTSHISSRELREYLEKKYGKCPKGGWQNIHIKEEDI